MRLIFENWNKFLTEDEQYRIGRFFPDEEYVKKVLDWAGASDETIEHLGSATMGSAYKINSKEYGDSVLKITHDVDEAMSAAIVSDLDEKNPNIYRIYKVGKVDFPRSLRKRPIYAILMEVLEQPTSGMQFIFRFLDPLVKMGQKGFHRWGHIERDNDGIKVFNKRGLLDENLTSLVNVLLTDAEEKGESSEMIIDYINKISNALTFLNDNKIFFDDLKASNILQRSGEPVIIDLGRTNPPWRGELFQKI